ncbi:methylated-DNA--[protein]-cysteine S-methyltransferase [Calidifontibacter terrae]
MTTTDTRNATVATTLGDLRLVATADAIAGIYFPGHWHLPKGADPYGRTIEAGDDPLLAQAEEELNEYLAGSRRGFTVPVRAEGAAFFREVWSMLLEIPYGATTTYGALSERLGNRHLAQRVGQAVGHNPVSIIVPCHRVVGADGSLTGYAGGLDRKRRLLALEEPAELTAARLF